MQAGADFGFQLLWAIALAALLIAALIEMSGRLSAMSGRTFQAAVRDRFGFHFSLTLIVAALAIDFLLATAELGGAAIAFELVTGVVFPWWVLPLAAVALLILWSGSFAVIEDGLGILGLVTLVFAWAAWKLEPPSGVVAAGFVPTLPHNQLAHYAFLVVNIVGATVSPYLLNFFGSGAVEEKWGEDDLASNRITAFLGMGFGAGVSMAALVVAAIVLHPRGVRVESYDQAAQAFVPIFGRWGVPLFAAALGIGCFGAAVEICLNAGFLLAQGFGWPWGANKRRRETARFTAAMTMMVIASALFALLGVDPLKLTLITLGLTVIIMPMVVLPLLVVMNDPRFVKRHTNGPIGNGLLAVLTVAAALMALVVVPLGIFGG